jgi:hypothetical protein
VATKIKVSGRTAYRPAGAPKGKYFFTEAKAAAWERKNGGSSSSKRKPAKRSKAALRDVISEKLIRRVFRQASFEHDQGEDDPDEIRIYGRGKDAKVLMRFGENGSFDYAELITESKRAAHAGGWYKSISSWSGSWGDFAEQADGGRRDYAGQGRAEAKKAKAHRKKYPAKLKWRKDGALHLAANFAIESVMGEWDLIDLDSVGDPDEGFLKASATLAGAKAAAERIYVNSR